MTAVTTSDDPFLCSGCAKPLDLGEYRSCDCPTSVGFKRGSLEHAWKKNRCAWCDNIPIRANLDGDDLCQACCNKWVRAEGFAAASVDGSPEGGDGEAGSIAEGDDRAVGATAPRRPSPSPSNPPQEESPT